MGRAMHIEVVAEGVETETQQAVLQQMQCEHYQGFLYAPGLPADQFRALLSKPLPLKSQGGTRGISFDAVVRDQLDQREPVVRLRIAGDRRGPKRLLQGNLHMIKLNG